MLHYMSPNCIWSCFYHVVYHHCIVFLQSVFDVILLDVFSLCLISFFTLWCIIEYNIGISLNVSQLYWEHFFAMWYITTLFDNFNLCFMSLFILWHITGFNTGLCTVIPYSLKDHNKHKPFWYLICWKTIPKYWNIWKYTWLKPSDVLIPGKLHQT